MLGNYRVSGKKYTGKEKCSRIWFNVLNFLIFVSATNIFSLYVPASSYIFFQIGGATILVWGGVLTYSSIVHPKHNYNFGITLITIGGAILTIIAPLFGCFILSFRSVSTLPIYIILNIGVSTMFVFGCTYNSMKPGAELGLAGFTYSIVGVMVRKYCFCHCL